MFLGLMAMAALSGGSVEAGASDAALLALAQGGETEAFATLHTRHYSRIYRLAYLKTNNIQDAEDVASETFVRALANLKRFRMEPGCGSLYPWLHRIALNLITDEYRHRPPAGVVSLDAPVIAGMRSLLEDRLCGPEPTLTPQEVVERSEVQQLVRAAIAALPPDQSDVLIYKFLGEMSVREIAPLLHRSEAAAKSLLHRATVALRTEITQRLDAVERLENRNLNPQEKLQEEKLQYVGRNLG